MDREYCEDCFSFHIYVATLAPIDKQFVPTCIQDAGIFTPISEIDICGVKNKRIPECIGLTQLKDTTKGVLDNG